MISRSRIVIGLMITAALCATIAVPVHAQYCVTRPTGAVAWWPFDEGSGSTAYDIVSGYNGTLNGPPVHAIGYVDSALEFDGSSDHVAVAHNSQLDITGDITVELWYRYDGSSGGTLLTKGIQTQGIDYPMSYYLSVTPDGYVQAGYESQDGSNQIMTTPAVPTLGEWHFLAYRRSGSYHELYVDSLVAISETTTLTPGTTTYDLTIGAIYNEGHMIKFFDGGIDEVTIYDRALDASEIMAVYNAGNQGKCKESFTDVTPLILQNLGSFESGFAWGDYDNDSDKDLYVANEGSADKLIRNDGGGGFTDVTPGVMAVSEAGRGATWVDYDNDGDLDLFRAGTPNRLFNNEGGGIFVDSTSSFQGGGGNSISNAWADFDGDGDLDVFSSQYAESHYFRNDGGEFINATTGDLILSGGVSNNTGDYDNDGDQDLFVGADLSTLLRNDGGGVFTDVSAAPLQCCGNWALCWGDYDNDGDMDICESSTSVGTVIFRNDPGDTWTRAEPAGILAVGAQGAAWGDYDNDGDLDLYLAGEYGHLFRNDGSGVFTDITSGPLAYEGWGRACDWVDYDDDGDLDIFIADSDGSNKLLRNDLVMDHHWLQVDLVGSLSNLNGVGSRIRVVTGSSSQIREITIGTAARTQGGLTASFGLSDSSVIDTVEVRWPSGIVSELYDVAADQRIVVGETGVWVTVTTNPLGLAVDVDGGVYTAPHVFASGMGCPHTIGVDSTQVNGDTTFVFSVWSDGGAISHAISPATDTTYTAYFDLLYTYALIDSISDVPDDQGGWVRIHFLRSVYDDLDETTNPISSYAIHRRVDNPSLVAQILDTGKRSGEGTALTRVDGREFRIVQGPDAAAPPGVWEVLGTVPARQQDHYIYLAPTLADSAETFAYSVYFIAAHTTTPSIYFDSPPDSGYSVDNIAPAVPPAFVAAYNTGGGNTLTWDPVPDNDLDHYRVYRGADAGFTPSPGNRIDVTTGTTWSDPEYDGWQVYYKVTAVDHAGNEGEAAGWDPATGIDERPVIPDRFALHQNVPNPFNPVTTIRYDVPAGGGHISLRVYDVAGRLVRTLVDAQQTPGARTTLWDGRNEQGAAVSSGVYFYRLVAPGYERTRKTLLMK